MYICVQSDNIIIRKGILFQDVSTVKGNKRNYHVGASGGNYGSVHMFVDICRGKECGMGIGLLMFTLLTL